MQQLIVLAAVLASSLVAATAQNRQCVSRQEFDTLKEQLARSRQETAAVKREVDSWQNSTILILRQYLIENPSVGQCACTTDIKQLWEKMDRVQDSVTANNAENATLQQQLLQYMQSLEQRLLLLQQQNKTLQRILHEQNRTFQEMVMLFSQNTIQWFPNGSFQNPAPSCKYIEQGSPSGYYWIQRPTTGYASQVYCDMTRRCNSTGGWVRVANFDMKNGNHCPQGFTKITSPKRLCRRKSGVGCLSTIFSAHGLNSISKSVWEG